MTKKTFIFIFFSITLTPLYVIAKQDTELPVLKKAPYQKAKLIGTITNPSIKEASGLVVSNKNDNILWVINDSNNSPTLYAVSPKGQTLCKFNIKNVKNRDWEALASFRQNNVDYLMIADVGDNNTKHNFYSLYVVKEPDLSKCRLKKDNSLNLAWQINFRYEDGPHDCEAITIDSQNKCVLILTKRTNPPILYKIPLEKNTSDTIFIAKQVAKITGIPPPTKEDFNNRYGKYLSQPTGMELSLDGKILVILTYKNAYYYKRDVGQKWKDVLTKKPQCILLPHPNTGNHPVREAISINNRNGDLFVTSEHTPAPIFRLKPLEYKNK